MSAWRKRSHTYPGRRTPEVWYERDVPETPGTIECISPELFYELERQGGRRGRTELAVRSTATSTTRSKRAPGVTPAERAARIDEISDEIPELRPNAKPTITFSLTRLARETIHGELAFSRRFMEQELGETGGWLLGERVPGKWLVSATDLGAGTRRSKQCGLSYEQVRHEVYRASLSPRGLSRKFLGCWHVHPIVGFTEPSNTDRKSALCGLEWHELNPAEFALDIIITPHVDRGWNSPQFTGWSTRRDRWAGAITEPATLVGLTADVNRYRE